MKYNFSAQFLKVNSPNTSFGDAWAAFCLLLLQEEDGYQSYISLKSPDHGVDILRPIDETAIQCKSDVRGAIGTMSPTSSVESLRTAVRHKHSIGWAKYLFATNANYSGDGIAKIYAEATGHGVRKDDIEFRGPEYWSALCERHFNAARHFLDYRLIYTEAEVEEAFRKAEYYDAYVRQCVDLINRDSLTIEVSNNKTPLVLSIPFAKELTIEHCLDVAQSLLGLTLDTEHYDDLRTSARPKLSIMLDGQAQPFTKKLEEYSEKELKRLQLRVKTIYSLDDDSNAGDRVMYEMMYKTTATVSKSAATSQTIGRFDQSIQDKMWRSVTSQQ